VDVNISTTNNKSNLVIKPFETENGLLGTERENTGWWEEWRRGYWVVWWRERGRGYKYWMVGEGKGGVRQMKRKRKW
jgi:hypothetical protein